MIIYIVSSIILQLFCSRYLSFSGIQINVMLIFLVEIALIKGSNHGQVFGFITGIIEDLITMGIMGARSLIRTLIGFLAGRLKGKFSVNNPLFQIILTFIVFVFYGFSMYFLSLFFSEQIISPGSVFLNAAVNSMLAPIFYFFLSRISAG